MGGSQLAEKQQETLSVTGRKWQTRPHEARDALAIAQQLGVNELVGRILAGRGIKPEDAEKFLKPSLRESLPDPFHLMDMGKAAKRVAAEIVASCELRVAGVSDTQPATRNQQPTIAVFGDYDVDGATSSALLVRYFKSLGITPLVHIPDRMKEGYGPNTAALLALKERGATLVITVDCGTMAFGPLAEAKKAGLDIIVVDHHKSDAQMPQCHALVNPNRFDETSTHTQLAAVGVTFLLLVAVNKLLRESGVSVPDLMQWLDLVALGTICDVVPLTGANRALVAQGLKVMRMRNNLGIAAAMDVARLGEAPGTYHAGFIIGPRINAGGRVGKSDLGTRLLTTEDAIEARSLAEELDRHNAERKAIESLVLEQAMEDAHALPATDAVIVVARKGWHQGVIGIVAGRLKEHFNKPVAVIALDEGAGKASARSITGVDLGTQVIAAVQSGLLLGGGGHAMAAGFSISEDGIVPLRAFFNQRLGASVAELCRERTLQLDGSIGLCGVTAELARLIEQAEPFGSGNPAVRLMLENVRVVHADVIKGEHVRAVVVESGAGASSQSLKVMAFRSADTPLGQTLLNAKGRPMHIAGQVRLNVWQGRESADFFVDDIAY